MKIGKVWIGESGIGNLKMKSERYQVESTRIGK